MTECHCEICTSRSGRSPLPTYTEAFKIKTLAIRLSTWPTKKQAVFLASWPQETTAAILLHWPLAMRREFLNSLKFSEAQALKSFVSALWEQTRAPSTPSSTAVSDTPSGASPQKALL